MSASSKSPSSDVKHYSQLMCFCCLKAKLRYSNTSSNLGRPFFGCPRYNTQGLSYCQYFKWVDSNEDIEKEVINKEVGLVINEKEVNKIVNEIKKIQIELKEIREMVQSNTNEEIAKKETSLVKQEAALRRS